MCVESPVWCPLTHVEPRKSLRWYLISLDLVFYLPVAAKSRLRKLQARFLLKFRSGEIAAQIRDFPPNATPAGFSNIVSPLISFRTGSCLLCGGAVARRSRATAAWDAWKGRGFGVSGVVGLKGQGVGDHGAKTCKGKVSFSHKNLCFCGVKPRTFF